MHKLALAISMILVLAAILSGCVGDAVIPTSTELVMPTSTQSEISVPVLAHWNIGDQPVASRGDFTFAVHMVLVDGDRIVVIYSASGSSVDQSFAQKAVQLTDETGSLSYISCPVAVPAATRTPAAYLALTARPQPLATQTLPPYPVATQTLPIPCTPSPARSAVTPLGQAGPVQFGAITFTPRLRGSHELHLLINPGDGGKPLNLLAAKVVAYPGADVSAAAGVVYRGGYLDQAGYRVSFNGFALARGDQTAQITQAASVATVPATEKPLAAAETQSAAAASWTPVPPQPTATLVAPDSEAGTLAAGMPVQMQATVRIEDLQSHQAQYLFLVVLTDGEIKGTLAQ